MLIEFGVVQIRHFNPCGGGDCDWVELDGGLQEGRWYASNQILPDGTQIVVGGRGVGTVEYVPANGRGAYDLQLLYKVLPRTDNQWRSFNRNEAHPCIA